MSDLESPPDYQLVPEVCELVDGTDASHAAFAAMEAGKVKVVRIAELNTASAACDGCPIASHVATKLEDYVAYYASVGRSHMKHSVSSRRQEQIRPRLEEKRAAGADFDFCRFLCDGVIRKTVEYTTQNPLHKENQAKFAGWLRNWLGRVPQTVTFVVAQDMCQNQASIAALEAGLIGDPRPQDYPPRRRRGF